MDTCVWWGGREAGETSGLDAFLSGVGSSLVLASCLFTGTVEELSYPSWALISWLSLSSLQACSILLSWAAIPCIPSVFINWLLSAGHCPSQPWRKNSSRVKNPSKFPHFQDPKWNWWEPTNPLATWCDEPTHWKRPDAGKDWRQEEKGKTEDEMAGWHHRLSGHESEQTPGVGDGQGGLACCGPGGCKESDTTERLNNSND